MIPYFLNNYKVIKVEKKITDSAFPKKNSKGQEELIATVKIYFLDQDGDQTNRTIRITFFGNPQIARNSFDKAKFSNLRIGTYKDNFYFRADSIILE